MRTATLALIAAISLLCIFSPTRPCLAQTTAYGTWYGIEDYSITYYDQYGNITGGYSESIAATLIVEFGSYGAIVGGPIGFNPQFYTVTSFGPTSASGSTFAGGLAGFSGNFDLTYQSILPDGEIVVGDGFAVADFSAYTDPYFFGSGYSEFASFEGTAPPAPEPPALAQIAIGVVVIAAFVGIRTYRAERPALAQSRRVRRSTIGRPNPAPRLPAGLVVRPGEADAVHGALLDRASPRAKACRVRADSGDVVASRRARRDVNRVARPDLEDLARSGHVFVEDVRA